MSVFTLILGIKLIFSAQPSSYRANISPSDKLWESLFGALSELETHQFTNFSSEGKFETCIDRIFGVLPLGLQIF